MAHQSVGYSEMFTNNLKSYGQLPKDRRFFLLFGIGLLFFGIYGLTRPHLDFPPGKPGAEVIITIAPGATGTEIGQELELNLVVKSAKKFVSEFVANPKASAIGAGRHTIQTLITSKEAITQLLDQKRVADILKVKEGSTFSDVLKELRANRNIVDSKPLKLPKALFANNLNSLEGSLFPANYSFAPNTAIAAALSSMVERSSKSINFTALNKGFQKFSPYQVLTIASMVQIEGDPSDYAKVAQTIYNRLAISMPLQLNSTVQYAANLRGRIALSIKATQIDSPYNTYRRVGLPPTPISNPSEAAVYASLNPIPGNWLYFITVKPRDTRFTNSFDEFQRWNAEFNKNLAAGAFK